MDKEKIDEIMNINQFLISQIEVGMALGMDRKNAIIRAVKETLDKTGHDFTDDLLLTYGDIRSHLHEYDNIILEGIEATVKAGRRPTIAAIYERRNRLKEISKDQFMNICNNLEAIGKIRVDTDSGKMAYFINEQEDKKAATT